VPSYGLIFISNFVEISSLVQNLKKGDKESNVNRIFISKDE